MSNNDSKLGLIKFYDVLKLTIVSDPPPSFAQLVQVSFQLPAAPLDGLTIEANGVRIWALKVFLN